MAGAVAFAPARRLLAPSLLQLPLLHPGPCSVWGLYARPSAPRSGSDVLAGLQFERQCNDELSRRGQRRDGACRDWQRAAFLEPSRARTAFRLST